MCLILFALNAHAHYRLVLVANRDEFYARRAIPLHEWQDKSIIAGKDVEAGGTWLGVSRTGRFAAVTNYREVSGKIGTRSRGELVTNFLESLIAREVYGKKLEDEQENYSGFNLIFGDSSGITYFSNRSSEGALNLTDGVYGLSNALLCTPWPKVRDGVVELERVLASKELDNEELFAIVRSQTLPSDSELPTTGVGLARERYLATPFICGDGVYGTRCTSLLTISHEGEIQFRERTFDDSGVAVEDRSFASPPERDR